MILMEGQITSWLRERRNTISYVTHSLLAVPPSEGEIYSVLRVFKQLDPYLRSLYFVTSENVMYHATGWIPPEGLDLRLRPWYVKAVQEDDLVLTEAFLNASRDAMIVTVAEPLRNNDGTVRGVVGGDVSLSTITTLVERTRVTQKSHVFLSDGHNLVAYSVAGADKSPTHAAALFQTVQEAASQGRLVRRTASIGGTTGYAVRREIPGTSWFLLSFLPQADLAPEAFSVDFGLIILIISSTLLVVFLGYFQQRWVVGPLESLYRGIMSIDVERSVSYRLPIGNKQITSPLINVLNGLLGRIESYLEKLKENDTAMRELNIALEKAVATGNNHLEEMRKQQVYWRALFDNSSDAIVLLDESHRVTAINESFTRVFGYYIGEISGRNLEDVLASHKIEESRNLTSTMMAGGTCCIESTRLHKDGSEREVEISGVPVIVDGKVVGGYGIYADIALRKAAERQIVYMSSHDHLTGVHNRAYFDQKFALLMQEGPWPITLIMGDMNGLKIVNDAFGHAVGDEVLQRTALALAEVVRDGDVVARLGGDEFALLLPGVDEAGAKRICDRILENCVKYSDSIIQLSLALGTATANGKQRGEPIFAQAEERMYHQKLLEGKSMRNALIVALRQSLHERSHETSDHSQRMTALAVRLAQELGILQPLLDEIGVLAASHDLGKIAVPESILEKSGALTPEEWETMKKHSEIGYRIASTSPELVQVAEAILQHHERWDGSGYPRGLKGEEICLPARIVAVVDAFDAMTSDRPYRRALTPAAALGEISRHSGTHFDPVVVAAFLRIMQ